MKFSTINNKCKHLLSVLLLLVLISGMIPFDIYSYADEDDGNNQYDTIPVDASGAEGELVKAEKHTVHAYDFSRDMYIDYSFYLVKVPYETKTIKFYDNEHNAYYTPNPKSPALNPVGAKEDGWWTIETTNLYDGNVYDPYSNTWLSALEQADCYCEEATYYELYYDEYNDHTNSTHFFIQAGDESSPLDVFAKPEGDDWDWSGSGAYFEDEDYVGKIILELCAGKRRHTIETLRVIRLNEDMISFYILHFFVLHKLE